MYKISPEFEGQRSRSLGTKNEKLLSHPQCTVPLTVHSRVCTIGCTQQQMIPSRGRLGVTGYAGGKLSACCIVLVYDTFSVP